MKFSVFHNFGEIFRFRHPNPGKSSTQKISPKFHANFTAPLTEKNGENFHSALLQGSCSEEIVWRKMASELGCARLVRSGQNTPEAQKNSRRLFSSGIPREEALLRKSQILRKSPEKWTFLSLAFYDSTARGPPQF